MRRPWLTRSIIGVLLPGVLLSLAQPQPYRSQAGRLLHLILA